MAKEGQNGGFEPKPACPRALNRSLLHLLWPPGLRPSPYSSCPTRSASVLQPYIGVTKVLAMPLNLALYYTNILEERHALH